jgi:uncharacterized membrane protein
MGRWIVIAVAIGLFCSSQAMAVKPVKPDESAAYTIVPFMPVGSQSTLSDVSDINDQGQAVGSLRFADGSNQVVHLDIARRQYTTLLVDGSPACGINNWNQIVASDGVDALFWESPSDDEPTSLPRLPNDDRAAVVGINDAGIALGFSGSEEGAVTCVVWRITVVDGKVDIDDPVPLPPLQAGAFTLVQDINEVLNGVAQVVGDSASEAVIWTVVVDEDGTLAVSSVQPVGVTGLNWSMGYGINNLADVCGLGDGLPYVDFVGQEPQVLPLPRDASSGSAHDINDDGDIVGYATVSTKHYPGRNYAQLWRGSERIDLATQIPDDSGWVRLSSAWRINNRGVIAGGGVFDVPNRGFIMIPNEN